MITKKEIIEAYSFLRKENMSISDEVLDFILNSSLRALEKKPFEKLSDKAVDKLCSKSKEIEKWDFGQKNLANSKANKMRSIKLNKKSC